MRIFGLLHNLKQAGHEIHFAYISQERGADAEGMIHAWDAYYSIPYERPAPPLRRRLYNRIKRSRLGRFIPKDYYLPYTIDEWFPESVNAFLAQLHEKMKFDVVMVEYVFISKSLEAFGADVLKILDTHDIFTNRHALYVKQGKKPTWFYTTERQERIGVKRADTVLAIQKHEAEFFHELSGKPTLVVGHVSTVESNRKPVPNRILFVGSQNPINVEGIQKFIANVLPRVRAVIPEAELHIVGRCANKIEEEIEGVVLVGEVDRLEPHYDSASVVVNPVEYGTGLKIKTIEALATACPLVTSPEGASGIEEIAGIAYLLAKNPTAFSEMVISILQSPIKAKQLSDGALTFVESYNEQTLRPLLEAIERGK